MQNNRKLLFFDIDKTLLTPYPWAVPASARIALKKAHDNGHLLFVNSGRTYAMIPEIIRKIGFDGYVCGCGSQIYMNGELLFSSSIPNSQALSSWIKHRKCSSTNLRKVSVSESAAGNARNLSNVKLW